MSVGIPNDNSTYSEVPVAQGTVNNALSFAETALKLGGKSDDEAKRTGVIDTADDRVESMFSQQYRTAASPIHRAVWERRCDPAHFATPVQPIDPNIASRMKVARDIVSRHKRVGSFLDDNNKITEEVLRDLSPTGYWGMLIPKEYGGLGSSFVDFTRSLRNMASVDPTVAGLASVHGCIGAVDPLRSFGSPSQKARFLPRLASGASLSAFALTEPGAGSDLTALKTTATLAGDHYLVTGEKLFITNVHFGRTIGLVCLIDGRPSVLIADLPIKEDETFQFVRYGLHALKHTHNQGMKFRNFAVPAENRLETEHGDGLTIAYHGLNLGRVSLCANAAGTMRMMLASMLPWAQYRMTYGESIDRRELVRRRIGELAAGIVGCDAVSLWCAKLLDDGYRGEMECVIAKIFGSEMQKRASIECLMKTHGGRSFLHGHFFGDNVHEFLAPCIYEGEGEMLGMAFFKSLVKSHGRDFFEPIGRVLYEAGIKHPNLADPRQLWKLRRPLLAYAKWWVGMRLIGNHRPRLDRMPLGLRRYAYRAIDFLTTQCFEVSAAMRTHQLALADRQCAMIDLSSRIQNAVVILCTCLYAAREDDSLTHDAAVVLADQLWRELTGRRAENRDWRRVVSLGANIAEGGWSELHDIVPDDILMKY